MTTFISRDYNAATSGYLNIPWGVSWAAANTGRSHVGFMYELTIFLNKILGYSIVGQTSWDINNTNIKSLVITAATNATPIQITTASAHGLIDGYVVSITGGTGNIGINGTWKVSVVNSTQVTLYGSAGTGTYTASSATMTTGFQYASGMVADGYGAGINFGAGFFFEVSIPIAKRTVVAGDIGRMLVLKSTAFPTKNAGLFKITAINAGSNRYVIDYRSTENPPVEAANSIDWWLYEIETVASGYLSKFAGSTGSSGFSIISSTNTSPIVVTTDTNFPHTWVTGQKISISGHTGPSTTIAAGSNGASLPQTTINTASIIVASTTIAAGSNGQSLPQTVINVASTAGFSPVGNIFITTSAGQQIVKYTGISGTTFTGCTGGTGTMSTGGSVLYTTFPASGTIFVTTSAGIQTVTYTEIAGTSFIGCSGGTGTMSTGAAVTMTSAANGIWTITQIAGTTSSPSQFSLNGSISTGIGITSGTAVLAGYPGSIFSGAAAAHSRIILQSPHTSGWQVRLAAEPTLNNLPCISVTTGFAGNSSGDFLASNLITNIAEYLDVNPSVSSTYVNTVVGGGNTTIASRMSMVGDGYGQFVCVYTRASGANNGFLIFGIPDSEPTLTSNIARLFCYGGAPTGDFGTIRLRTGATTNVGNSNANGVPELCALTSWGNLDGTSATNPMLSGNAGDSPFTGTTEILPIEIWGGVTADIALSTSVTLPFSYNTRFMGIAPALRNGRNNFGDFTISTDEVTARTITAATNASPIQITTSAANALTTGQTVTISGVTGNTAANGTWVITVINTTNFTLTGSAGNGAYVSGGTVNGCARWLHLQNGIYLQWNGASGLTP